MTAFKSLPDPLRRVLGLPSRQTPLSPATVDASLVQAIEQTRSTRRVLQADLQVFVDPARLRDGRDGREWVTLDNRADADAEFASLAMVEHLAPAFALQAGCGGQGKRTARRR